MSNDTLVLIFVFLVPPIVMALGYFLFLYYQQSNKQKLMVNVLSDASHHIIDNKKQKEKVKKVEGENIIKKKLNYAGFLYPYAEYVFYFICLGFGFLVGFFIYIIMESTLTFVISAILFSLIPYLVLEKIIASRQEEFNFGLQAIIDKVTSMMKSGVGFEQAFKKSIMTSKSQLTKNILGIYLNEKDIIGEDRAFEKMFNLIESKEFRIFYLTVNIGRQSGGKFSNTLETLRKTLQDQGTIKKEITASTREIKVGTYMILALTVGLYILMNEVFKGALNVHFFGSSEGKLQIFFIAIWVVFGLFVNNMLTKIKG